MTNIIDNEDTELTMRDLMIIQNDILRKIEFHLSMMTDEELTEPDTGEL